jgi:superfamily II DNA/RNA helicase
MQREAVQVLVGTPAKVLEVMTTRGGLQGGEVKTLIVSRDFSPYEPKLTN